MRRLFLLGFLISAPCYAEPVIPNFTQGSSTSRTETTTNITESIQTTEYNSGFLYSVTGSGIQHDGSSITPPPTTISETINGTTYTWQGLDLDQRPNWTQTNQGNAFQFTETYQAPGMQSVTDITRTIQSTSVTDTTTIFSQQYHYYLGVQYLLIPQILRLLLHLQAVLYLILQRKYQVDLWQKICMVMELNVLDHK